MKIAHSVNLDTINSENKIWYREDTFHDVREQGSMEAMLNPTDNKNDGTNDDPAVYLAQRLAGMGRSTIE